MKDKFKHFILKTINPFFNPSELLNSFLGYAKFIKDLREYSKMEGSEPIRLLDIHPCLHDRTETTIFDKHYFYQDIWAFKRIHESTTRYYGFHEKGGKEVLEAFSVLNNRYSNIELAIRSSLDPEVKRKYSKILKLPNVKVYEKVLPRKNIELLYSSSDILLSPGYAVTAIVTLEGMSYEMPVIAVDSGGMTEAVQDGKNGFLIKPSEKVPYNPKEYHYSRQNASKRVRLDIVKGMIDKTAILIENKSLRKKMGEEGRKEIEEGRFSIEKRNRKLKRIFEEAMKK